MNDKKTAALSAVSLLLTKRKLANLKPIDKPALIQGLDGKDGLNGRDGLDGKDGLDGRDGLDGKDGLDGRDGLDGKDGLDGRAGEQGLKGDRGPKGEKGDRGPKGDKGDKGDRGPKGEKGDAPEHDWKGTELRFKHPDGSWGKYVDLRQKIIGHNAFSGIQTITSSDSSLVVTSDGLSVDLTVSQESPASNIVKQVRNETGATLVKGTVVYISGASGNKATVSKAIATGDATSAQTLGVITNDIVTNQNGYVTVFGSITGLDTSMYADGAQLYLSATVAGAYTNIKQYAPNHLVYVGIVTRSHQNQGSIEINIQNGYELEELHDVKITNVQTHDLIRRNAQNLWENFQGATGSFVSQDGKTVTVVGGIITSIV